MLPSGLVYSIQNMPPNLPASVTNFNGPVLFSRQKLQNINCIIDPTEQRGGLYLGDTLSVKRIEYLIQYNVQAILSCAYEAMFVHPGDARINIVDSKFICAMDNLTYDIQKHFEQSYEFIESNLANKANVLVHCHAGVSRSAAIVIAYVMKKQGLNFESAFEFVKRRRQRIRPNENFRNRLKEFEKSIVLNDNEGKLTQKQDELQQNNFAKIDSASLQASLQPSLSSTPLSYDKSLKSTERISEPVDINYTSKVDPFLGRKEEIINGGQTSQFSISELLMKSQTNTISQKQLQARFNDFTTQLQYQTQTLFGGKQDIPRRSFANKPPPVYLNSQPTYPSYQRPIPINPQRNISYQPIQTQSIKTKIQKHMSKNKPKVTVVQGGLPDSYKSIAGMMAPSSSKYETQNYYRRY